MNKQTQQAYLGAVSYWTNRVYGAYAAKFLTVANFLMLVYVAAGKNAALWLALPGVLLLFYLGYKFDKHYVVAIEQQLAFNQNPDWRALCQNAKEANERLAKLECEMRGVIT